MSILKLSPLFKQKSLKPARRPVAPKSIPPQNAEDLEKMAMEAMADLSQKFPAWASGDVQKMKTIVSEAGGVFGEKRAEIIRQQLYPKAHDLKGQGATFGYPLITDIGSHMCRLMSGKKTFSSGDLSVLRSDIMLMETVLWKKLKGDGGKKGSEILEKLK